MTFLDFFAGVGGFRRGMELAGHKCVGFCEVDKYAVASYTSMHLITAEQREYLNTLDFKKRQKEILKEEYRNGEWYCDDVRRLRADDVPRADVWCFGFPCQDISVAGKQLGFAGHRSSLFFAVTRVIRDLEEKDRPSVLFIENVKNLLSVNRGLDFAKLLVELDEIGYDCEWQVLNSKHFGVPQNRERVFVIGHLRGRSRREVFPVGGTNGENRVSIIGHRDGYKRNMQTYPGEGITEALDTGQGGGREFHVAQPILFNANDDNSSKTIMAGYYKYGTATLFGNKGFKGGTTAIGVPFAIDKNIGGEEREIANCITSREDRGVANTKQTGTAVAIPVLAPDRAEKRQNGRRFKEDGEPMFTLTGQDKHGVMVSNANKSIAAVWSDKYQCCIAIRKLTPKECFRLQGWTDDYFEKAEFVNSNSQLYKQAGNGVTVNVIYEIAKKF
jgi:DNA (cytosine-5)-methyltransferase 1